MEALLPNCFERPNPIHFPFFYLFLFLFFLYWDNFKWWVQIQHTYNTMLTSNNLYINDIVIVLNYKQENTLYSITELT
jgi:hypothetical protein